MAGLGSPRQGTRTSGPPDLADNAQALGEAIDHPRFAVDLFEVEGHDGSRARLGCQGATPHAYVATVFGLRGRARFRGGRTCAIARTRRRSMKFVRVLIAAATIAVAAVAAPPLAAQIPFWLPIIGSAAADPVAGKLTIHGANFGA